MCIDETKLAKLTRTHARMQEWRCWCRKFLRNNFYCSVYLQRDLSLLLAETFFRLCCEFFLQLYQFEKFFRNLSFDTFSGDVCTLSCREYVILSIFDRITLDIFNLFFFYKISKKLEFIKAFVESYKFLKETQILFKFFASLFAEMDDMILNCNQNTIYVLNTSYSYSVSRSEGSFARYFSVWWSTQQRAIEYTLGY